MHGKFCFKMPKWELLKAKREENPKHTGQRLQGHLSWGQVQRRPQTPYLSVSILVMLLISGVIILLNEAKVLLPLPLQGQLPPLGVCREIALKTTLSVRGWVFTLA